MERPTVQTDDAGMWLTWERQAITMRAERVHTDRQGHVRAWLTVYALAEDGTTSHVHGPTDFDAIDIASHNRVVAALATRGRRDWRTLVGQVGSLLAWGAAPMAGPPPTIRTMRELLAVELPARPEVVRGILTEGVWLLGGHPKRGKSWLAFALSWAIAAGGHALGQVAVPAGRAAYLALEDTERRIQKRAPLVAQGGAVPERLHCETTWPRLDAGGLERLDRWLADHPDTRLVVIDTLQRARANQESGGRLYQEDYEALSGLARLAGERGVCILVVHHLRKGAIDDPLEALSGTMGLSGAADGILVLERKRGAPRAVLHVTGRDLDQDRSLALAWDDATASFTLLGDAEEAQLSDDRQAIVDLLAASPEALRPKDIAEMTEIPYGRVRKLLLELANGGYIRHEGHGRYSRAWAAGDKDSKGETNHGGENAHTSRNNQNNRNSENNRNNRNNHEAPPMGDCSDCADCSGCSDCSDCSAERSDPGAADQAAPRRCPTCHGPLHEDLCCMRCMDRVCRTCGGLVGTVLRAECASCGLRGAPP